MKRIFFILMMMLIVFSTTAFANEQEFNAILVNSLHNADFPSANNLSGNALKEEIHQIVDVAGYYDFNTIVFQARPQGDALYKSKYFPTSAFLTQNQGDFTLFDPLHYFVKYANSKNIQIYASVDLFKIGSTETVLDNKNFAMKYPEKTDRINDAIYLNPADESVRELVANGIIEIMNKYDVAGVILSGLDQEILEQFPNLSENIADICNRVRKKNQDKRLGITLSKDSMNRLEKIITTSNFDFALASIESPVLETKAYLNELAYWKKITQTTGVRVMPQNKVSNNHNRITMNLMMQYQSQNQMKSYSFDHYGAFLQNKQFSDEFLTIKTSSSYTKTNLGAISTKLEITRPNKNFTTSLDQYFIMGTSDPNQVLFLNGKELDRKTKSGTFGALIVLSAGVNTVTINQGNQSVSVQITKQTTSGTPNTISKISANSVVPKFNDFVRNGDVFKVSCIAPSGATVTARLGDQVITLHQIAIASDGIPAKFTGEFLINYIVSENSVEKIGA
ncbi:MAG: family 10 glycosylhydrolase, partial [Oscillospiraceae bacterium]